MFESLDLPVLFEAEVVVAGGGPAGIAAALAAARLGKRVVLLEQTGSLGGMGTNALVPAVIYQSDGVNWVVGDFCRSIIEECCREMGIDEVNPGWQEVDAEILKRIYDDRLLKAGVKLFYMIRVADVVVRSGKLESLLVATPHGLRKVKGEVFVDATGDAAVAAFAGVPFDCGDAEGRTMSPTLCPQFSNIDIPAYDAALREGKRDRAIWHELLERGEAPVSEHHFVGVCTYGNGTASGNLGHIYGANTLDETELTNAYIEGRKFAKIYHDFYRRHVPGFEHSDLVQTAPLLGVRESRRIRGEYQLNGDDYRSRAVFADEIGRFSYPIDIHSSSTDPEEQKRVERVLCETRCKPGESYGIPYRSLIPLGVENLLVAGRCVSCDREIQSSLRVIPGCFITGQAAGAAAAMAAAGNVRSVDTAVLQKWLKDDLHVYLPNI